MHFAKQKQRQMNGDVRYTMYQLLKLGVHRSFMKVEHYDRQTGVNFDIAILPKAKRKTSLDIWPYSGIVFEVDGPSHFYLSPAAGGANPFEYTVFSKHRHR